MPNTDAGVVSRRAIGGRRSHVHAPASTHPRASQSNTCSHSHSMSISPCIPHDTSPRSRVGRGGSGVTGPRACCAGGVDAAAVDPGRRVGRRGWVKSYNNTCTSAKLNYGNIKTLSEKNTSRKHGYQHITFMLYQQRNINMCKPCAAAAWVTAPPPQNRLADDLAAVDRDEG